MKKKLYFHFLLIAKISLFGQTQGISTFAGNHQIGYTGDGGPATSATFSSPCATAKDSKGNLFIADESGYVIRKVDVSGIVTTFAGNGTAGYSGDGGQATLATMFDPRDIAVDSKGNLFIAETNGHRIRKVDTNGIITTFAGNGTGGYSGDGGQAINATIKFPMGIAIDKTGNVFLNDEGNNVIRKIDTNGIITTFAGTGAQGFSGDGGPAVNAQIYITNGGIDVDSKGNLFICDRVNLRIRKVDTLGVIHTIAGSGSSGFSGDGGPATNAALNYPNDVCVDGYGNLYITDADNYRIRKVDNTGIITTIAGNGTSGYSGDAGLATAAQIGYSYGVYADTHGNVFISDGNNHVVRKVSACIAITPAICMVEVDSLSQNNVIYWNKTQYPSADTFYIYRDTSNNNYALIGKVLASALSEFSDTARVIYAANGNPNVTSWRYKISFGDTCGGTRTLSPMSPWHQTIYQYNLGGLFIWNHYQIEGQPTPVPGLSSYRLRRDNLANGNYITAATASASSTNINDPQYSTYQTTADWRVETVWNITCSSTLRQGNNSSQSTVVKSRSNVKNNRTTGVNKVSTGNIKIFPNPAQGLITVSLEKPENTLLEIYNIVGEKVLTEKPNGQKTQLDISSLPTGIFEVRVLSKGNVVYREKLIKQ